jgi:hypothetical protein
MLKGVSEFSSETLFGWDDELTLYHTNLASSNACTIQDI